MHRNCIRGLLSDRIVLLTTQATKYYSLADRIVQLDRGTIAVQGDFETLKTKLPLTEPAPVELGVKDREIVDHDEVWSRTEKTMKCANMKEEEEDRKRGLVSLKVYLKYLLHGASPLILVFFLVVYFSGAG